MKTLNKYGCDNICNLLEIISVQAKQSVVNFSQGGHGLKVPLVSDGYFTKSEIRKVAEKWVQVKDDPDIIVAEVDESIEILGNVTFFTMH